MTEEEFDMEKKEAMKWLSDLTYTKGFHSACDAVDYGLSMLGPITITVEHARKLVEIVRKTQDVPALPVWVQELLKRKA